jgi:hypothetical protein
MSKTHNADNVCPVIEEHRRKQTAKVWFSGAVVRVFKTYDDRVALVNALGDEINEIPSEYVPYLLLDFRQMTFVCATLWSEKEGIYYMEIDMAGEAVQLGEIPSLDNPNETSGDEELKPATLH